MNRFITCGVELINAYTTVYALSLFFSSFAQKRFPKLLHGGIFTLAVLLMSLDLIFVSDRILNIFVLVAITVLLSYLYKLKWHMHILLSLLVYAMGMLVELVTVTALTILFSVDAKLTVEGIFYIIGILISKFLLFVFILLIRMLRHRNLYGGSAKHNFVIMLIPFSTIVMMFFEYSCFMQIPQADFKMLLFAVIFNALLIIANIIVLDTLERLYQNKELESRLEFSQKLIEEQKIQYNQICEHQQGILKLRHDQIHFALGLRSLLEQGQQEAAMAELNEQLDRLNTPKKSQFPLGIIGTLLSHKSAVAADHGIVIEFSHSDLTKIALSQIDLAVLLGNALDNAIEAVCQLTVPQDKVINLMIKVHHNQLLITVKNRVLGDVDVEHLVSTKPNRAEHGFGIISMRDIVQKHHGDLLFSCHDRLFELRAILRNSD